MVSVTRIDRLCYGMLRRARGLLLRFVRRRPVALLAGLALVAPAGWVEFSGRFDAWWVQGVALVAGATGFALAWTALVGVTPDWIDDGAAGGGGGRTDRTGPPLG
jgi:hypothetical protein